MRQILVFCALARLAGGCALRSGADSGATIACDGLPSPSACQQSAYSPCPTTFSGACPCSGSNCAISVGMCDGYAVWAPAHGVDTSEQVYYDARSGTFVAAVTFVDVSRECIAGPALFTPPASCQLHACGT